MGELASGLPPNWRAAHVRLVDVLEGPLREQLMSPENPWAPAPPKEKVWVRTEQEYLEICRGCAEMGLFTFLRLGEVMQAHGQPVLNGLMGVQKKDSVLPNGLPILCVIMNAIPANAYQELVGGEIAMFPHFAQWNGIQLDRGGSGGVLVRGGYVRSFLDVTLGTKLAPLAGPSQASPRKLRSTIDVQSLVPRLWCIRP